MEREDNNLCASEQVEHATITEAVSSHSLLVETRVSYWSMPRSGARQLKSWIPHHQGAVPVSRTKNSLRGHTQ